jgi:hypothetical protein
MTDTELIKMYERDILELSIENTALRKKIGQNTEEIMKKEQYIREIKETQA